ncbi:MAG: GWxTD domain-containing protein, partial [Acidobacteria bacterium]|nr:GWxTD domain-containing protein [Acidobacteriota bacterium]
DQIERVPARQIGLGQFVIGASKVRPRLDATFTQADRMGFYLQVYNLGIDETSHKSNAAIEYRIRKDDKEVSKQAETSAQLAQGGEQLTIEKTMSLASFAPGKYKLEIQVTDQVGKKTITTTGNFTIKAAEKVEEKPAAKK